MTPDEIKTIRKGMNLSQTDFARLLGVAQATVSEWEQGKYEVKGAALTLLRIARSRPEAVTNLEESENFQSSHWGNTVNAMLLACESSYRDGSKWHLMQAVFLCVENQIPVPEWIRAAMSEIIKGTRTGDVLYWEDALGDVLRPAEEELHILSKRELEYKAGKKEEIMHALDECFKNHIQPPKWLRDAFTNAVKRIYGEIGTDKWDDVFGSPFSSNTHIGQAKKAALFKAALGKKLFWEQFEDRIRPRSIEEIVQQVAEEQGYSISQGWRFYKDIKDLVPQLNHSVLPRSKFDEIVQAAGLPPMPD
jgi:transcriptional regulator with XRE-family HTH domain